ncbi:MAG: helix-hairpin-helix domain-containing protein [Anaeromyxobacter sp.]
MVRRAALLLLLSIVLLPAALRGRRALAPDIACRPEGRGVPPRHWMGCAADPGPRRGLTQSERLVLGLPVDPNLAAAEELASVPGLSRSLGAAVVADREQNGPFGSVDDLLRVSGIGPRRLERARAFLDVHPAR